MEPSDSELLGRYAATSCGRAFELLVRRHAGVVFGSALRRLGDRGAAEDVAQDVFVLLARRCRKLEGHPALSGWLLTTTRLQCQNRLRAERRQRLKLSRFMKHQESRPIEVGGDAGRCGNLEATPLLDDALHQLREPERCIILLKYVEEISR